MRKFRSEWAIKSIQRSRKVARALSLSSGSAAVRQQHFSFDSVIPLFFPCRHQYRAGESSVSPANPHTDSICTSEIVILAILGFEKSSVISLLRAKISAGEIQKKIFK